MLEHSRMEIILKILRRHVCMMMRFTGDRKLMSCAWIESSLSEIFWKRLFVFTLNGHKGGECVISSTGGFICTLNKSEKMRWLILQAG